MKMIRSLLIGLALAASVPVAQAHDAFNIGISLGGHGYHGAPVARYHAVPQVIYYDAPRIYRPAPYAHHHAPAIVHRDIYYGAPRHHFSGHGPGFGYGHGFGHGHRGHHRHHR